MNDGQKKLLKETLVCGGILAVYYVFTQITGLRIPCLFYEITGLKCPGCGLTAMCIHLAHFRFDDALHANPLMFFLGPLLVISLGLKIFLAPEWLKNGNKFHDRAVWVLLGIAVCFWVVRNVIKV